MADKVKFRTAAAQTLRRTKSAIIDFAKKYPKTAKTAAVTVGLVATPATSIITAFWVASKANDKAEETDGARATALNASAYVFGAYATLLSFCVVGSKLAIDAPAAARTVVAERLAHAPVGQTTTQNGTDYSMNVWNWKPAAQKAVASGKVTDRDGARYTVDFDGSEQKTYVALRPDGKGKTKVVEVAL